MRVDSLEVPKEIVKSVMRGRHIPDILLEVKFPDREASGVVPLKKTISAVRRVVRKYMPDDKEERIRYVADALGLRTEDVVVEELDRTLHAHQIVMGTSNLKDGRNWIVRIAHVGDASRFPFVYLHLYDKVKPSYHRTRRKYKRVDMDYVPVADLEIYVAEMILLKAIDRYVKEDPSRIKTALFDYSLSGDTLDVRYYSGEAAEMLEKMMPTFGIEKLSPRKGASYHGYRSYATGELDVFSGDFRNPFSDLHPLLAAMAGELVDIKNLIKDAATEKAAYAKAFQTKKHIPKSHLARMEDNRFLDVYGYVELDEDVDLEKFAVIEENLVEFVRATGMMKAEDHAFRIKRLGNYKAAGIYFSGYRSTIFDLRHPHAFGHEWMHQLDYTLRGTGRNVHEESDFHPLYIRYRSMVEQAIEQADKDDPLKSAWHGSSKYNRGYYMKKTEAFARLGEVYLSTLVSDDNSLVKPRKDLEASLVHPTDDVTERLVVDYFNRLFERMEKNLSAS